MDKEIELFVKMCEINKKSFTANEMATLINLKYTEGVYPYLRILKRMEWIHAPEKGVYEINEVHNKVRIIKTLVDTFGKDARVLLNNNTKKILEKLSINPIQKASELPAYNLKIVKDIARKTRIIHYVKEKGKNIYFLRAWEDPTHKLLDFFDIQIQFDENEHKNKIIKYFSGLTISQKNLTEEDSRELERLNISAYLNKEEFILDKLQNINPHELQIISILTDKKTKNLNNLFEIAPKINDWKMKYIYNTDKIEGNPLTMDEVRNILTLGGETVKKEKKAVLETINSRTAVDNIFDPFNQFNLEFIKKLHLATQQGIDSQAGSFKKEENYIADHNNNMIDITTPVKFTQDRMEQLVEWYGKNKDILHPIVLASVIHNQFVYTHPFNDGNGRVARLLFNFILIKKGYFPIIFFNDLKERYYAALRQVKNGDMKPFITYCSDLYREQLSSF